MRIWEARSPAAKKARSIALILCALFFIAGGLSAGVIGVRGIKENGITAISRNNARFVRQERDPVFFWITVSFHGVFAVGFCGLGGWLIHKAVRG